MIIAGPCSYIDDKDTKPILECAEALTGIATHFRCKPWLGGTRPGRYAEGIGEKGLKTLEKIDKEFLPAGVEVQIPEHIRKTSNLSFIWVGARNSHNYGLYRYLSIWKDSKKQIMVKRGAGMTVNELIGVYDIFDQIYNTKVYIIERGINTVDRTEKSRWALSLNSILKLKYDRPDMFKRLIVDCSHSTFIKSYVGDIYKATKEIGVEHHMFECTIDGYSRSDQSHMLSVKELHGILK